MTLSLNTSTSSNNLNMTLFNDQEEELLTLSVKQIKEDSSSLDSQDMIMRGLTTTTSMDLNAFMTQQFQSKLMVESLSRINNGPWSTTILDHV